MKAAKIPSKEELLNQIGKPSKRKTRTVLADPPPVSSSDDNEADQPLPSVLRVPRSRRSSSRGMQPEAAIDAPAEVIPPYAAELFKGSEFTKLQDRFGEIVGGIAQEVIATPEEVSDDVPIKVRIGRLNFLQRTGRKFSIKMQSRCNRAIESLVASSLGFRVDLEATERKAVYAKAAAIRKAVETNRGWDTLDDDEATQAVVTALGPIIQLTALTRKVWDEYRDRTEREMRALAQTLPIWQWADGIQGLGPLGVAVLVAEGQDPWNYATVSRLWKRLGLAVIGEERQRRVADAEKALLHGYNPERHGQITGAIIDPLFRRQSVVTGPYRVVYDRRREHTKVTHPDWSDKHSDKDARRIMMKELVKDYWAAWRKLTPNDQADQH